ncbi:MAG TPA: G5 domain-containing protein [Ktedonobacteraceae bacterium]
MPHHIAKVIRIKRPVTHTHTNLVFGCFIVLCFMLTACTVPQQQSSPQKVSLTATTTHASQAAANASVPTAHVTTKQVTETQDIPFSTQDVTDSSLLKGQTKVTQAGKDGVKTLTYKVTYTNGQQTSKTLISSAVTTQPVDQIVTIGTYVAPAPTPVPTSSQSSAPAPAQSCYPLTNGGSCYEPGEYCRNSDHGAAGIAGDGAAIICADNDGWRWEPR